MTSLLHFEDEPMLLGLSIPSMVIWVLGLGGNPHNTCLGLRS
jgi:hypothetical protein